MEYEQYVSFVKKQINADRFQHTLGVVEVAIQLAQKYNVNIEQARTAAILHDVAKCWPIEKQKSTLLKLGVDDELLQYGKPLWHAHVGAWVAEDQLNIGDQDILNAIRYHTSGRRGMTDLEKVICLADYIEPGRSFDGIEQIRTLAMQSLEEALIEAFNGTISWVISSGSLLDPTIVHARNSLIQQLNEKSREVSR